MKLKQDRVFTVKEISKSYDELFQEAGRLRDTDAFYQWVLKKINVISGNRLLDVACGEGILLQFAENYGLHCIGIDLSMQGARLAYARTRTKMIAVGDGEKLPFPDESFDYVTNIGSLEHFLNPKLGLDEMFRVLTQNGTATLILPNSYYLIDIFWHVWRTGYSVSHRQPLERFAAFREWGDLIEQSGFRIVGAYKYNLLFPRSLEDIKWYRQHPRKLLNLIFSPFIPFNLSNHFLYVCRKAKG
jgi:ubiquinone/menaquinone biosynthesis C-methylase UbiE